MSLLNDKQLHDLVMPYLERQARRFAGADHGQAVTLESDHEHRTVVAKGAGKAVADQFSAPGAWIERSILSIGGSMQ